MHVTFADVTAFVHAIAWPAALIVLAVLYRQEIPKLVQALAGRVSKLSAAGVTFEFILAKPVEETFRVRLEDIREASSAGLPPASGVPSLIELAKSTSRADYLVIDLRDGKAWLTSRLYLFAVVLPPVLGVKRFVFVGNQGSVPRHLLGFAPPESIVQSFERRYGWLREARAETLLQPLAVGQAPYRYVAWSPYGDTAAALSRLADLASKGAWNLDQAEALNKIVPALISPIDLLQPGQLEEFVTRFLASPRLRRPHVAATQTPAAGQTPAAAEVADAEWVQLESVDQQGHPILVDEHARWIENERQLVDRLGDDLSRECVVLEQTTDEQDLIKAILRRRGDFVAVTDRDGRFDHLIDRSALLEKIAAA